MYKNTTFFSQIISKNIQYPLAKNNEISYNMIVGIQTASNGSLTPFSFRAVRASPPAT